MLLLYLGLFLEMKHKALKYIVCANCQAPLKAVIKLRDKEEVLNGRLFCENYKCKKNYSVVDGLGNFVHFEYKTEGEIADSFGFEWHEHLQEKIEKDAIFGRSTQDDLKYFFKATGLTVKDIRDKVILDAGCGSAKLTKSLSKFLPKIIFGIDIHSAVKLAYKNCTGMSNCEIIQADIFHPPFKSQTFDLVWCNGVLHHTPDPSKAFDRLAKLVKTKGLLYVWVYGKRFSPYKLTKDIFRLFHLDRIPYNYLFKICQIFSLISCFIHFIYRLMVLPLVIFFKRSNQFKNSLRYRTYQEFLMTWFDALSPKYDSRHTKQELTQWFKKNGFTNLRYYENQIGICGIKS